MIGVLGWVAALLGLGLLTSACGGLYAYGYYTSLGIDFLGLVSLQDLSRLPLRFPASVAVAGATVVLSWIALRSGRRAALPILTGLVAAAALAAVLLGRAGSSDRSDWEARRPCIAVVTEQGEQGPLPGACVRFAGILGDVHVFAVDHGVVTLASSAVLNMAIPVASSEASAAP